MTALRTLRTRVAKASPFQVLPPLRWAAQEPTYGDASPALIQSALRRSQSRPSGNWYVFAASTDVGRQPFAANVAGEELVAWRDDAGDLHVGPAECPHLGADLSTGRVECGTLICPWHGLRLSGRNPITGRAALELALPAGGHASVGIYDARGALVNTLVDRTLPSGYHRLAWNGDHANGAVAHPGMYFVRAITAGGTFNQRLVYLR